MLPPAVETRIRAQLADGEPLAWVGQPAPKKLAVRPRHAVTAILGVYAAFLLLSCCGGGSAPLDLCSGRGADVRFACQVVMGSAMISFVGLAALLLPVLGYLLLFGKGPASRTWLVVTDRRALVWLDDVVPEVQVVEAAALAAVHERTEPGGLVTLVLEVDGLPEREWPSFRRLADPGPAREALARLRAPPDGRP